MGKENIRDARARMSFGKKAQVTEFIRNYKVLFRAFLVMMILPMLAFTVYFCYTRIEWKQEAGQYQEAILSQAVSVGDNILEQAEQAVYSITFDNTTGQLLRKEYWDGETMFTCTDLIGKLFSMLTKYECVESLGVYFYKNNSFVTDARRWPAQMYDYYLSKYGTTLDAFIESTNSYKGSFLLSTDADNYLVLYMNNYNYSSKVRTSTSFAILSGDELSDTLRYLNTLKGSVLSIFNRDGRLIGSTDDGIENASFSDAKMESVENSEGEVYLRAADGGTVTFEALSGAEDIRYVMHLTRTSFYRKITVFTAFCVGSLLLLLILGIVMAVYFTKMTSAPIRHLLSLIDTNRQKYGSDGDFMREGCRMLEEKLAELQKDNSLLTTQAVSQSKKATEQLLQGFMKGLYPNEDWILEIHEKDIRLRDISDYRVVLFCFYDIAACSFLRAQQGSMASYSLLLFSLKNVADEVFLELGKEAGGGLSFAMDNMLACIVPVSELPRSEADALLKEKAAACIDFFRKIF